MIATIAAPVHRPHGAIARAVPLTFLLGATVVVSWVAVRGPSILNGIGPWLHATWFVAWVIQALLAFGLMIVVERLAPSASRRAMIATILGAWVGEFLVASFVLSALVGELDVVHGPYVWLIGTGFGIQPAAAILGGLVARRRSHAASALR